MNNVPASLFHHRCEDQQREASGSGRQDTLEMTLRGNTVLLFFFSTPCEKKKCVKSEAACSGPAKPCSCRQETSGEINEVGHFDRVNTVAGRWGGELLSAAGEEHMTFA